MAKTKTSDFSTQRNILNFRPDIHFVEPPQVDEERPLATTQTTLDQTKSDIDNLIDQYADIADTADAVQAQIDQNAAGIVINLDSNQDAAVLEALKRHFGDPNKTSITYADYMGCLSEINEQGANAAPAVDPNDIVAAASDQYRDMFGTLGLPSGLGRPELSLDNQPIKPIDPKQFQGEMLIKLFDLLKKPIEELVIKKIEDLLP